MLQTDTDSKRELLVGDSQRSRSNDGVASHYRSHIGPLSHHFSQTTQRLRDLRREPFHPLHCQCRTGNASRFLPAGPAAMRLSFSAFASSNLQPSTLVALSSEVENPGSQRKIVVESQSCYFESCYDVFLSAVCIRHYLMHLQLYSKHFG